MDPVSVFNALHDTKILKYGRYNLRSGLVAPYYMNLRRLPLYPELMEAIVNQVYDNFLSPKALSVTMSQIRRRRQTKSNSTASQIIHSINKELEMKKKHHKTHDRMVASTDSDSQLGEELELETGSVECEDDEFGETSLSEDYAGRCRPILSGVPYGGVPLAMALASKAKLPMLFEPREVKGYGDHQPLIEDFSNDTFESQDPETQEKQPWPVILIEDVICSGASILDTAQRLEKQNLKVEFVICIVDRQENGVKLLLEKAGIRVLSLYKISAILRILEATNRISSPQFIEISRWISSNQFQRIGVAPASSNVIVDQNFDNKHAQASLPTIEAATN